ncbi:hypothetical protein MKW98_001397 [Papaver atlanticum]|uniref:NB-ARC domain-containing protein n=1 Tax=Papaver atlanticum TaxID=357466 RepID=A0AAD4S1T7_9MAGN|nr:hypothetical protein MKW98_001397 [Papaver atlanticum]
MTELMSFANGQHAQLFNYGKRHRIGRESQKKIVIVDELINEGRSFVDVSNPCSVSAAEVFIGNIVAFASREDCQNQVMATLQHEGIHSVGIYGMGGVGKTTLMKLIHEQVLEEKVFDVNLRNIQNDIVQQLDFHKLDEVNDESIRATMLSRQLKQENKILVIFDDVWKTDLNLFSAAGISYGENHQRGCKILMTTRSLEVCNSLLIQKSTEVGLLSDDESWHLFKTKAGDVVDSPDIQTVAKEIVKECGRLPLALDTLGRALRNNNDKLAWDNTVSQLRSSDFADIGGMKSRVHSSIKLSYDFLGNDILKNCFLLCCLFPEDFAVHIDHLLFYAMGDKTIHGDKNTMKEVRARLHAALYKLVALGLLVSEKEFSDQTFSAKMHDIVRDVAISIASGEGSWFFVKAGLGLQNWPEAEVLSDGKCSRISLTRNNITVLPNQPELPHLLSLSLRKNSSLEKVPGMFFTNMKTLQSLDISLTSISSLPSSFSSLVNLHSLDMGSCKFHSQIDISVLGGLKKLEILRIAGMELSTSLPEEIGGLSHLKWLDLSNNPGLTDSCSGWEVGGIRKESCKLANLDEMSSLTCLNRVSFQARWAAGCVDMFQGPSGAYRRHVSPYNVSAKLARSHFSYVSQCCHLSGTSPFCNSVKVLVGKAEKLEFRKCSNLKSVVQLATSSSGCGFNNLKHLEVEDCNEMECVLSAVDKDIPTDAFAELEIITLKSLGSLKEIFHVPMPAEFSLENIKRVRIYSCPNLACIFSFDVLLKLKYLEELLVDGSKRLMEVFSLEPDGRVDSNEKGERDLVLLPQLRLLLLFHLGITTIWKGIFSPNISSLANLSMIKVIDCHELRYLFCPAIVTALQQLEVLQIRECSSLVTVVASTDELTQGEDDQIMNNLQTLFNLRMLKIEYCNSLKFLYSPLTDIKENQQVDEYGYECDDAYSDKDDSKVLVLKCFGIKKVWGGGIPIQSFRNVTEARFTCCGWLKQLIPIQVLLSGGLSQLQKLYIEDCQRLEEIFYIDDTTTIYDEKKSIPLFRSPESLRLISVEECDSLKHILPMRLLIQGGLPKLEAIAILDCATIEVIIYEDVGSNGDKTITSTIEVEVLTTLRLLNLIRLPNLSGFHDQHGKTSLVFGWPSLVYMYVVNCNLKRLPLSRKNVPPKLEKLRGDSEAVFEKWLKLEDESVKKAYDPCLRYALCFCSVHDGREEYKDWTEVRQSVE